MDIRAIFMGFSFALMWASAFTTTRMIVTETPPLMALSLRFALSGVIGVGIALAMGETWRRLTRNQWRAVVILGLCQNALYLGLNWVAMQWIEAGLASIIAATMPLMVAAIGWAVLGERLPPMGIGGLVLGLIGVVIIMGARLQGGSDPVGVAMGFLAALALAVATLTVRGASGSGNVMMVVGLQMLVGAASLAVIAPVFEDWQVTLTPRLVSAFAYTVVVPGLLATWVWFQLVGRIGAVRAATFHFLSPFFGVSIAALFLGEKLSLGDILGVAIIMAGILAVQLSRQPRVKRPPPA
ncbi:DMT family transporter [Paracoccus sp. R12_1]|jgi:drug/metabolite transporter (DMT)-like permease|uniref:DMT family transporter n=1 Tax=unclassified Paracoccus (in: a-proteobacteria) TaxID=2688777 RepID=UPI001ADB350D|nr:MULTISPECIES: DMT family transporter [unclassified Paracoccus (in: a-proteobacteria)]MBO9454040.1 DMT family transporter [Paracoccus sp. R12_2]MBO9485613.1 DMT family transporter [Paracoccus sp. R12_1]